MNDQFGKGYQDPCLVESLSLYDGKVKLEFDPEAHLYFTRVGDERLVASGVTNVCGLLDKSAPLKQWAVNVAMDYIIANIPGGTLAKLELHTIYGVLKAKGTPPQKLYPRVTVSVIDLAQLLVDAARQHTVVVKDAASVGDIAHKWLERYIKAKIDNTPHDEPLPDNPRSASCVQAALGFFESHKVEFVYSERKIYSVEFNYAGTADLLAIVTSCGNPKCCPFSGRVLELGDFKTANGFREETLLQTAAYKRALLEEFPTLHIAHRRILKLGKEDGAFENRVLLAETFEADMLKFLGLLQTYNVREQGLVDRASVRNEKRREKAILAAIKPIKLPKAKIEEDIPMEPVVARKPRSRKKLDLIAIGE